MTQGLASQSWRHAVALSVFCAVTCMGAGEALGQQDSAPESLDSTASALVPAEAPDETQEEAQPAHQFDLGNGVFVDVHGLFQGQILAGTDPTCEMTQSAFRLRRSEVAFTGDIRVQRLRQGHV